MKKLITLTLMGVVLMSGTAFAQDEPVRDRPAVRHSDFRIPRAVRDNVDIQECLEAYRTASAAFKTSLMGLRTELEAAAEAEKDAVKQRIRSLLHDHRIAQREFRQKVRRIIRALREARVATDAAG